MADTAPKPGKATPPKGGRPLTGEEQAKMREPKPETRDKRPSGTPTPRRGSLKGRLAEFFTGIGMTVSVFNTDDGVVIVENATAMAEAWDNLAQQNPTVRKNLERLLSGGAWGGVVMVTGSVALQLASNHGFTLAFPLGGAEEPENNGQPEGA